MNKMCPICYLKNMLNPKKLINDTEMDEVFDASICPTPPMGWSSWSSFKNDISEELILDTARAFKQSGLMDAGYKYLNLDDDWHSCLRDTNGELQGDLSRFPRNIKPLVEDINALGLKVGIYSSNGTKTCEDLPASLGNEDRDAYTFAKWGIEYFKYDFCHHEYISKNAPLISAMSLAKLGEKEKYFYSADTAHLEGSAKLFKDKKMPNGVFVSGLDANKGSLTFENVTVDETGKYALTLTIKKVGLHYDKYANIIINDTDKYEISSPGCHFFNWFTRCQIVVELKAGINKIKIFNPITSKLDSSRIQYQRMGKALINQSKRFAEETGTPVKPMVYSICEWGSQKPYLWGRTAGNLWRTTGDANCTWSRLNYIYRKNVVLYKYADMGHYNDPDILEVGNGKLTPIQNRTHFSLWCMMAAPLILGNDLRKFIRPNGEVDTENDTYKIVTNKNLISIDQDKLCRPAKPLTLSSVDILARPLENSKVALCFYNRSSSDKTINYNLNKLVKDNYVQLADTSDYEIVEQWTEEKFNGSTITANVVKDGVKVYVITPKKN